MGISVFDQLDAILASLPLRKARMYTNIYKGRTNISVISDEKVRQRYNEVIKELRKSDSVEEFRHVLDYRGKDGVTQAVCSAMKKKLDERLPDRVSQHKDEIGQDRQFSDYFEYMKFMVENDLSSMERLLREIFDYDSVLNFYTVKQTIIDETKKLMARGQGKTDEIVDTAALRHVYDPIFGKNDRLVLPIDVKVREGQKVISDSSFFVSNIIPIIIKYFKSIGNDEEAEALENRYKGMRHQDAASKDNPFKSGKYSFISKPGREMRFGKLLNGIMKKSGDMELSTLENNDLRRINLLFNQREKSPDEPCYLILSRHPYDIAGMSTDRGWTSCQNLDFVDFQGCIATTIQAGALICYFCRKSDTTNINGHRNKKINIQNPIGRILVKTYTKNGDPIDFEHPNFLLRASQVYGTVFADGVRKLQNWLNENWNDKIEIDRSDRKKYRFAKGQYLDHGDNPNYEEDLYDEHFKK